MAEGPDRVVADGGGPVVVGVDGSESSLGAVVLAAREAVARRLPLRVVHAFVWPLMGVDVGPAPEGPPDGGLANDADRLVRDAVRVAREAEPRVRVTGEVVAEAVVPVLLAEAGRATLLVLGDRGLGGFTGLLLGSVTVQVSAHAACPVLVSRGEDRRAGPVVVGVDGSGVSALAIGFAFDAAAARGAELVAVHCWSGPGGPPTTLEVDEVAGEETRLLTEALTGWRERYPDVRVTQRVARGRPGHTLVEKSATAQLVVVGARGRGGFTGLVLGSVSQSVLHHAQCPVAVVRTRADAPAGR